MDSTLIHHRVPFHDVDVMQMVWHGHYMKYFELARTQFMQALELDWPVIRQHGFVMPVVSSSVEHRVPLRYDELVTIRVSCEDPLLAHLILNFQIMGSDLGVRAWGRTKQVYMALEPYELCFEQPSVLAAIMRGNLQKVTS